LSEYSLTHLDKAPLDRVLMTSCNSLRDKKSGRKRHF
jgi:hypothetical protein